VTEDRNREHLKLETISSQELLKIVSSDLELVYRGVDYAERREKVPSYRMELIAVRQILDTLPGRVRAAVDAARREVS
jgi:hypothetical protein